MTTPVSVSFNEAHTRAAFTLFHEKGNIITADMVDALGMALQGISSNPALKLVTLEGAGADFSFGASIPEHTRERIAEVLPAMHRLIDELLDLPAVTAAVVRGRCFGGGFELALACDFIFAADDAVFGLPEIALGVFPPAASALLPLRIGASRAARAILTGEPMSAAEWHGAGLVTLLAPEGVLAEAVETWFATHLAPRSAAALRHAAAASRMELSARVRETLPALERLYLDDLMRTHDAAEGVAAFMERRPPTWTNR
ncbi:MAG: enoyl-CoA hydratase/isomerase family protein [Acidobacteria bacterium]|nr:enoyl-CoA hydratase/isomerase family protein [Acidobacteriota bacterium]